MFQLSCILKYFEYFKNHFIFDKIFSYFSKIIGKSITLVHFIEKTFNSKDLWFFVRLFKLYIRPILVYNFSAWMPYQVGDIRKIESVQATFTRLVCRKFDIIYDNYKHGFSFFNLDTLEIQKNKYNLILYFKIIHNLIDFQFDDFFSISPSLKLYQLRRNKLQLTKQIPHATLIKVSVFLIPQN